MLNPVVTAKTVRRNFSDTKPGRKYIESLELVDNLKVFCRGIHCKECGQCDPSWNVQTENLQIKIHTVIRIDRCVIRRISRVSMYSRCLRNWYNLSLLLYRFCSSESFPFRRSRKYHQFGTAWLLRKTSMLCFFWSNGCCIYEIAMHCHLRIIWSLMLNPMDSTKTVRRNVSDTKSGRKYIECLELVNNLKVFCRGIHSKECAQFDPSQNVQTEKLQTTIRTVIRIDRRTIHRIT